MIPTNIVIDDVLDSESVSKIYESLDESTKDPFFYMNCPIGSNNF